MDKVISSAAALEMTYVIRGEAVAAADIVYLTAKVGPRALVGGLTPIRPSSVPVMIAMDVWMLAIGTRFHRQ